MASTHSLSKKKMSNGKGLIMSSKRAKKTKELEAPEDIYIGKDNYLSFAKEYTTVEGGGLPNHIYGSLDFVSTPKQARRLADWLINAADYLEQEK
jgi:hypothetical protein